MASSLNIGSNKPVEVVAADAVAFLNSTVLQQTPATLMGYEEESGVVKITLQINGETFDSYATKDGKLFFPEVLPIDN